MRAYIYALCVSGTVNTHGSVKVCQVWKLLCTICKFSCIHKAVTSVVVLQNMADHIHSKEELLEATTTLLQLAHSGTQSELLLETIIMTEVFVQHKIWSGETVTKRIYTQAPAHRILIILKLIYSQLR